MSASDIFLDEHPQEGFQVRTGASYRVILRRFVFELSGEDGEIVANEPYRIQADRSVVHEGRLDGNGKGRAFALFKAQWSISFPRLADGSWGPPQRESAGPEGEIDDTPYMVKRAETLGMILYRERGVLSDADTLSSQQNDLLFKMRSPSILRPGDLVHLPKLASRGTQAELLRIGESNHFRVRGRHRPLRLRLVTRGQPIRNAEYRLDTAGTTVTGNTDGDGILLTKIPLEATQGRLEIDGNVRTLIFGAIDPIHTVTGIQARLNNLGFHTGAVDGVVGAQTRRAIRKFQASCSLVVDGIVGPKTRNALFDAYGM